MNQVVESMLHLVTERKRIIEGLAEQKTVITYLTEHEILSLKLGENVVISKDWDGYLVSMRQPSCTKDTSILTTEKEK